MSFMRKSKKLLASLLCLLLVLSLFPAFAFAEEEEEEETPPSVEEVKEDNDSTADDISSEDAETGDDDADDEDEEDEEEENPEPETDPEEDQKPEEEEPSEPGEGDQEDTCFEVQEEESGQEEVFAAALEDEEFFAEEDLSWDRDDSDWDNEELLDGYAQMRLNNAGGGMLRASFYAGRKLNAKSATQGAIYFFLKSKVVDIAAGNLTSSSFSGSISDLGLSKTRYTAQELGLEKIDDSNCEEAFNLLKVAAGLETNAALGIGDGITPAIRALLGDCPYELYWFDKKTGWRYGYSYSYGYSSGEYYIEVTRYTFILSVASAYAGSGDYTVSTANADLINTAISTAQGIADEAAGLSDREKLAYFKTQICSLTSYNHEAADDSSTPYGNPWQLIWVFDGDSTTTVVCEGYSKAFQYLCELSSFTGDVTVCSVTGSIGGGHMWNIVSLDGYKFLVDVTNCDEGTVGAPDKLFMTGYDSGSVAAGYTFDCGRKSITYTYDSSTRSIYGDDALTLAPKYVTVTVSSENDGEGSVGLLTGGGRYAFGETVTVTASEENGYAFLGWYRDGSQLSTSRTFTFTATENAVLTARYQGYGTATLTVNNAQNVSINGELRGSESSSVTFPVGTVITLAYTGDGELLRWCNESGMTESRSTSFSFTLVRDKTVTAVADEGEESGLGSSAFVEFVSDFGQVLQAGTWNSTDSAESHVLPIGPSRTGKRFGGWSLDGQTAVTAADILTRITSSVRQLTVNPLYTEEDTVCTVTVDYDGTQMTFSVRKGLSVVLRAKTIAGKSFDRWEDGSGTLLGTGESYSLSVTGDRTLYAVYTSEAVHEDVPVLAVTGIDPVDDAGVHKIAFRVTRQIPEGYTLQRLLILVSDDPIYGGADAEDLMVTGQGIPQAVSTRTERTGTLTVNKRVTDDSTVWYARGYMLVTDSEGQETEIYTPIVSSYYSKLIES